MTENNNNRDDFSPSSKPDKSDRQIEKAEKPLDRKLKEFFTNRKAVVSHDIPSKPTDQLKDQQTVESKETESNKPPIDKEKLKMREPEKKKKKDKIEFKCPFESGTADLAGFIFQSFYYYSNNSKINIFITFRIRKVFQG